MHLYYFTNKLKLTYTVRWKGFFPPSCFFFFLTYLSHLKDSDPQNTFLYYTKIMQVNTKCSWFHFFKGKKLSKPTWPYIKNELLPPIKSWKNSD